MNREAKNRLRGLFPELVGDGSALEEALLEATLTQQLEQGAFVCMEGDHCAYLPLVLSGTARVYKVSEGGRALTLYRIEAGESCILTTSCILSRRAFPAFAEAETDVEAVLVPTACVRAWLHEHDAWRTYLFALLARRFADVIELVEAVAFQRMDMRLAKYLLESAGTGAGEVHRTHELIATDLGTSREVVSRILKDFEHRGLVSLARGSLHVEDAAGLAHLTTW